MPKYPNLSDRAIGADSIAAEMRLRDNNKIMRALGAAVPSFTDEARANQVFPIKITNTDTADHLVAIFAGDLDLISEITSILGITVDGIAKESADIITGKVTCATAPGTTIEYFQKFVKRNPTRIMQIKVKSNLEEQLDEPLVFSHINPFAKAGQQVLNPGAYAKETNQNNKLVTIPVRDIQLDDQTVLYVNILAGSTLQLSLTVGATSNAAAVLAKQAEVAYSK